MMFDKEFWNKEENVNTNNCYTYAIDRPFTRNGHLLKFETSPVLSCKAISYIIDQDGVIPTESNGKCKDDYHKIFIAIGPDSDFNFYREHNDGSWAHKRGYDPISQVDSVGNVIKEPVKASKNYSSAWGMVGDDYSESCGVYCAKN